MEWNYTKFDIKNQAWKYAIRRKTLGGPELRVVVAFDNRMAVITVICLEKQGRKK